MRVLRIVLVLCLAVVAAPRILLAQEAQSGRRTGRSIRNMSPQERERYFEQRRQEYVKRLKEALKPASDEEWQILETQLKKIGELRRAMYASSRTGSRYGTRGRSRTPPSVQKIREQYMPMREQIQELIKQDNPPAAKLKGLMDQYRALRAKRTEEEKRLRAEAERMRKEAERKREQAAQQLKVAREELKSILTIRQEAVLLMYGILD